ncbi:MAG: recombinase family protein, partial [Actinomycetota bacterium]|nr:recombinase family protein [Actinomycetota bacterium]
MMSSTNGHSPKRAILYTRVSGDRQRDHGYSLADQKRELEEWAAKEGYDVLEVVEDGAWSGGFLERPGLDRVREQVAAGGVDAVVALFRDRLARGVYAGLLAEEFAEHGCRLIALNAQVDDSPEGELHGGMLDLIAGWERKKIAERTRRGKLQKARQGKVVATTTPNYGFKYNAARDGYEIDEDAMRVIRRIFRMVGVEHRSLRSIKKTFEAEGLPTPMGKKYWSTRILRFFVLEDVYRSRSYEEIAKLVTPEVATRLDPEKRYGIWWFNRRRTKRNQVAESGPKGRVYRKQDKHTLRPKEEWIAV